MKVLLRQSQTGLYHGKENAWVEEIAEALEFETLAAAGNRAAGCNPDDVIVIVRYDDPPSELALNPAFCVSAWSGASMIREAA
jgi:hypothetical protein